MKKIFIPALIVFSCILFMTCSDDDSSTGPKDEGSYKNAILSHNGFDFSRALGGEEAKPHDGYTAKWRPIGKWSNEGIWYWTSNRPNRTQSLGAVDIYSITTIDTTAATWDTEPPPLSKNDVVITQCLDGFVKFQVTADVDTSSANVNWDVHVRYLFSPTPSFSE